MEYTTLNNGVKMPMAGIGTFLLTPDWKRYSFEVTLPEDVREWPALEKRTGRISVLLERRKPGRVLLDQLDFRMTENQKNP